MAAALEYSPYAYRIHEDPYPTYARLREEAPLYRNDAEGFWAISRHADVLAGFRDGERLSSANGVSLDPASVGPHAYKTASFLAMDEPMHGRMRALVSRGFTAKRVLDLEPRVRQLTRNHMEPAIEGDDFDFLTDVAGKLPMDVVSELIGVPAADRDELRRLADLVLHRPEGVLDIPPAGIDAVLQLVGYYAEMVAERKKARRTDDLTSALLDAEIDGDRLDDDEIIGFLFLMVVAGNETTTKLLGNAWYWAWRFPDERAKPFADPGRIPQWVEETLRFDTSTQAIARTATVDIPLYDGVIRAGDRVLLLPGSANRDPRVFDAPDTYDFERPAPQLQLASFGFGRHFCLGAFLARLETRVVLEEAVAAISSYEIDPEGVRRVHSANVRGFSALPTRIERRTSSPAGEARG